MVRLGAFAPVVAVVGLGFATGACTQRPPPRFPLPNGASALSQLRKSTECAAAVQATAKFEHFGREGRFRGDMMLVGRAPDQLRMDVVSPFGAALATLTTDGHSFAMSDLRNKRFLTGPATACNIARLTSVALPSHVLISLLRGQPPIVRHDPTSETLLWSPKGYYVLSFRGTRDTAESLKMTPHPDDLAKPWAEQRFRLLEVEVTQQGRPSYRAEFEDHAPAPMAQERVDPDGIDPPLAPSGPPCTAELPRRILISTQGNGEQEVRLRYESATWNPPIEDGIFQQTALGGMTSETVNCTDP